MLTSCERPDEAKREFDLSVQKKEQESLLEANVSEREAQITGAKFQIEESRRKAIKVFNSFKERPSNLNWEQRCATDSLRISLNACQKASLEATSFTA